jgi:hypothetical protein
MAFVERLVLDPSSDCIFVYVFDRATDEAAQTDGGKDSGANGDQNSSGNDVGLTLRRRGALAVLQGGRADGRCYGIEVGRCCEQDDAQLEHFGMHGDPISCSGLE